MRYDSFPILLNKAMNANQTGSVMDLSNIFNASLAFIVTSAAAPTGTVSILFSDDNVNFGADPAVANPTVTANGVKLVNIPNVGHGYMRVDYTTGTGNGTLNVVGFVKGA